MRRRKNSRNQQGENKPSGNINEIRQIVNEANKKLRLIDVLRHFGLKITKNSKRPEWSVNVTCPIPTHKGSSERSPSFGYNFVQDRFYCFGCNAAGKSVEFLAAVQSKPRVVVARKILERYGTDVSTTQEYNPNINKIILTYSVEMNKFIFSHREDPDKFKYAETLCSWVDQYLETSRDELDEEELVYRTSRVLELLNE